MRGLTILEALVTMVLVSMVMLGGVTLSSYFMKEYLSTEERIDEGFDRDLATQYLLRDLQIAQLSFNYLYQADDTQKNFWDYIANSSGQTDQSRILSMGRKSDNTMHDIQQLWLVIPDPKDSIPYPYQPRAAYQIPPPPTDIMTTPPVSFRSVNQGNIVNQLNPGMWDDGHLLMLHTPVWFPGGNGYPRQMRFLGYVTQDLLVSLSFPIRYQKDPVSGASVNNADRFFRRLPAVGGGAPVVFIQKVLVISYDVVEETRDSETYVSLYRTVWGADRNPTERNLITRQMSEIILSRPSIFKRVISVDFKD